MERRFVNRLRRDLQTMQKNYVDVFTVEIPNDDMKMWIVSIDGPKGSVYEGEKFK
jgi:ubiquitin-conjugating enzyme E2 W